MTTKPQPEPHLDADQLTAFAEGVLSPSERSFCLQHLGECARCREVVFLAGASLPSAEPLTAPKRSSSFTWWPVLSLGAATLAAVLITIALLRHSDRRDSSTMAQITTRSQTAPSPQIATAAPMDQELRAAPAMKSAPKPSPAKKITPKPQTPALNATEANDANVLDAMKATAQPVHGVLSPPPPSSKNQPGALGGVAGAMSQPSQALPAASPGAADGLAMPAYSRAKSIQTPNGSAQISGTVTDSNGASIPHAKVELDLTAGTAHRETFTDDAGRFTIGSLQPGKYRLEVSSRGFMMEAREVELGTSQLAHVDSKLAVGDVAEAVTVGAAGAMATTNSASMQPLLPDKRSLRISVSSGTRTLAMDATGKLFLSKKAGNHWKAVRGPWKKSAVTDLSLAPDQIFKVTTAEGSWLSSDGEHWHPAS